MSYLVKNDLGTYLILNQKEEWKRKKTNEQGNKNRSLILGALELMPVIDKLSEMSTLTMLAIGSLVPPMTVT